MHLSHASLGQVSGFELSGESDIVRALPPLHEKVLPTELYRQLKSAYEQLYPSQEIVHMPYFYLECGRILLGGDIIGSVKPGPNNYSSSVIHAHWPASGDLLRVDCHEWMRVGVIQYYLKHSIKVSDSESHVAKQLTHIFSYVHWRCLHPHETWFGVSATVGSMDTEILSVNCFLPAQRIAHRCAFANVQISFPTHTEKVLVTCPIPLKFSI